MRFACWPYVPFLFVAALSLACGRVGYDRVEKTDGPIVDAPVIDGPADAAPAADAGALDAFVPGPDAGALDAFVPGPDAGGIDAFVPGPDAGVIDGASCPPGWHDCVDSGCTDVQSDELNCGMCGKVCNLTEVCCEGVCATTCTS